MQLLSTEAQVTQQEVLLGFELAELIVCKQKCVPSDKAKIDPGHCLSTSLANLGLKLADFSPGDDEGVVAVVKLDSDAAECPKPDNGACFPDQAATECMGRSPGRGGIGVDAAHTVTNGDLDLHGFVWSNGFIVHILEHVRFVILRSKDRTLLEVNHAKPHCRGVARALG